MARLLSVALFATAFAVACDDDSAEDTLATEQVTGAVEASADLARLVQPLDGSATLLGLSAPEVVRQKVEDAIDAYRNLMVRPDCVTTDTDFVTFLELGFDACSAPLGLLTLDGSLRAELELNVQAGEPVSLTFGLSTDRLEIGTPRRRIEIASDFQTTFGVGGSAPVQFLGDLSVTELGKTLDVSAEASWAVDGDCVTLDAGAQIGGTATGALGTISASVENLSRCEAECPTNGTVYVSYGQGTFLTWAYDGADVVLVTGPGGKQLRVPLACGN